jgi:hypothetical protein
MPIRRRPMRCGRGCRLLTCAGDTFTGRVAGTCCGRSGSANSSPARSKSMRRWRCGSSVTLSCSRECARLAQNRHSSPLFYIERHARDLEAVYLARRAGDPPQFFPFDLRAPLRRPSSPTRE